VTRSSPESPRPSYKGHQGHRSARTSQIKDIAKLGQQILRAEQNVDSSTPQERHQETAHASGTTATALREGKGETFAFHWSFATGTFGVSCPECQRKLSERLAGPAGAEQGTGGCGWQDGCLESSAPFHSSLKTVTLP